jgi:hypothetical protein
MFPEFPPHTGLEIHVLPKVAHGPPKPRPYATQVGAAARKHLRNLQATKRVADSAEHSIGAPYAFVPPTAPTLCRTPSQITSMSIKGWWPKWRFYLGFAQLCNDPFRY